MKRILVACEFSGTVRDAFTSRGYYAVSCDLLPSETWGPHYLGDVMDIINEGWDLMIAHPPCTYLTVSGNKWMKPEYKERFPDRLEQRESAVEFFMKLYEAAIPKLCIENPIGIMSTRLRKPNQVVQPCMFGHPERKATCLWLKGLPNLIPTNIVELPKDKALAQRLHYLPPSKDRWKERSKTFQGIAEAMAEQWS